MPHRSYPPSYFNPPRILPATVACLMRAAEDVLQPPPPSWVEPRGVYWARFLKGGRRVLYAVDSRGNVIKQIAIKPGASEDDAIEYLAAKLDAADPLSRRPHLAIVRAG